MKVSRRGGPSVRTEEWMREPRDGMCFVSCSLVLCDLYSWTKGARRRVLH